MLKPRRFRLEKAVYQKLHLEQKVASLMDDVDILTEEIDDLTSIKEEIIENYKNKEAYNRGKTHDVSDVTIRVSYPREVFRTPNEWDWDVIVTGIYPAIEAKMISWTVPHPDAPTW